MQNLLPFEKIERKILVRKEVETDYKYGCAPEERKTEEIVNYGIVNIDKPKGPTSHQVSDYVQKILHIDKSGHSGTLDPAVSGVLPVALGRGTRIVQGLLTAGKEYVAIMHLHREIDEKVLRETIQKNFIGKIMQMPPIKSSVKRQLRPRTIYYLDILEIDGKDVLFKVGTEAGTYIRKLCLHPKTEIISTNGIITALDFHSDPQTVYSFHKGKLIKNDPSATQKMKSPPKWLEIKMQSGVSFVVTPDHELFASTANGYKMIEAGKLKTGEYLVKSLKFPVLNKKYIVSDFLDEKFLIADSKIKEECKKAFIREYGSVRAMNRKLNLDRKAFLSKSKNAITIRHLKLAGIYDKTKSRIGAFKTEKGKLILLRKFSAGFFYLLGLMASDGNNTREKLTVRHTRLKFHNTEEILIDKFISEYKKLFANIPISKKKITESLFQVDTSNSFLATVAANFGIKSPYKNSDIEPILYLESSFIKAFLRGYFDGDGNAYFKNKDRIKGNYSNIRIYCCNFCNIKRIHQMLLKIEITNRIIKTKSQNNYAMYIVEINDLAAKRKFAKEVGSNHPGKMAYLNEISALGGGSSYDNCYIGLHFKNSIRKNKKELRSMGGNLYRVMNIGTPATRGFYKKCCNLVTLPRLDDFVIEKIIDIKEVEGEGYVYDMTVPNTHNFLIETGFISSNCHDIGQKLKTGAHMAELRRTKAGPFDESTLFTLQELTDAYYYWKNENNEKFLKKAVQPVESGVKHLPKIWVFDTTVESLCHGVDLKVPGISKANDSINENDVAAIMTLKNELIALGTAKMNSDNMLGEKGIAIQTKKVFMVPGTYKLTI